MATNLSIDPELLDKALAVSGEKTKKATVNKALREFVACREQEQLLDLFGEFDWDDEFDYKRERTRYQSSPIAQRVSSSRHSGRNH